MNTFSNTELKQYNNDGFIIVRKLFSNDEIKIISNWIDDLSNTSPTMGKEMFYYEDSLITTNKKKILNRLEKFCDYNKQALKFAYANKIINRLQQLFGEEPVLFKDKINFKNPGGSGFKAHQDIQSGWLDYATYFISVLITIDPSTTENGCLEIVSGQHKRGWIGRLWHPLEGDELKGLNFVKYETYPGDVVFFDCYAPHQSKDNLSKKKRRNIYLTYNKISDGNKLEKYFLDKRKNYPPDNERDPKKEYIFKV